MAERAVPHGSWTRVPGAGIEVMHTIGRVSGVWHQLGGAVTLGDGTWTVRAVPRPDGVHPEVLGFFAGRARVLAGPGEPSPVPEDGPGTCLNHRWAPSIGMRGRSWVRRSGGWFCSREDCPNCPADWAEMRDFFSVTGQGVTRVLPGEA